MSNRVKATSPAKNGNPIPQALIEEGRSKMKDDRKAFKQKSEINELRRFLIKNGLEDQGDVGDNVMLFCSDNATVFLRMGGSTIIDITFAGSEYGFHQIKNATKEQMHSIISLMKSSEFISLEEPFSKSTRIKIKQTVLGILNDFVGK